MAVESMIQRVLNGWDHTRPLGSLNRSDLQKLANAAITGWVIERAKENFCSDDPIAQTLDSLAQSAAQHSENHRGNTEEPNADATIRKLI